ncbi:hypothetical protein S245_053308 [Arachis hypogaea]
MILSSSKLRIFTLFLLGRFLVSGLLCLSLSSSIPILVEFTLLNLCTLCYIPFTSKHHFHSGFPIYASLLVHSFSFFEALDLCHEYAQFLIHAFHFQIYMLWSL